MCEPTCSFVSGAVGVLDGQFELLDEISAVETALLPDVQESLHVFPAVLICFSTHTDIYICTHTVENDL